MIFLTCDIYGLHKGLGDQVTKIEIKFFLLMDTGKCLLLRLRLNFMVPLPRTGCKQNMKLLSWQLKVKTKLNSLVRLLKQQQQIVIHPVNDGSIYYFMLLVLEGLILDQVHIP